MESKRMTQQDFASLLKLSPAALSSIFNERTKPTLNIVEAIKTNIPDISLTWLMFGEGEMYENDASSPVEGSLFGDGDSPSPTTPPVPGTQPSVSRQATVSTAQGMRQGNADYVNGSSNNVQQQQAFLKYLDKTQRKITEIRVFYDDQTYESFVPKK